MAEAILAGLISKGVYRPEQIAVHNRQNTERLEELSQRYGVRVERDKQRLVQEHPLLILAVKPKDMSQALGEIAPHLPQEHLLLSVAAGISTGWMAERLGRPQPVIRAMPNTSAAVGLSATACALGAHASQVHARWAEQVFSAVGTVTWVEEELMDAVTALSGSGPAYFYYMVEALEQAAVEAGLPPDVAGALLRQTILGAAAMLQEPGADPAQLRKQVTSPGGTTMAALQRLDEYRFAQAVRDAVWAARNRAREMRSQMESER